VHPPTTCLLFPAAEAPALYSHRHCRTAYACLHSRVVTDLAAPTLARRSMRRWPRQAVSPPMGDPSRWYVGPPSALTRATTLVCYSVRSAAAHRHARGRGKNTNFTNPRTGAQSLSSSQKLSRGALGRACVCAGSRRGISVVVPIVVPNSHGSLPSLVLHCRHQKVLLHRGEAQPLLGPDVCCAVKSSG